MTGKGWRDFSACLDDPDVMFPDVSDHAGITAAKRICDGCPVTDECLTFALEKRIKFGVFGGLTEMERGTSLKRPGVTIVARDCSDCGNKFYSGREIQHRCSPCSRASHPPTKKASPKVLQHIDRVRELLASGMSLQKTAKEVGVSYGSLWFTCKALGIRTDGTTELAEVA